MPVQAYLLPSSFKTPRLTFVLQAVLQYVLYRVDENRQHSRASCQQEPGLIYDLPWLYLCSRRHVLHAKDGDNASHLAAPVVLRGHVGRLEILNWVTAFKRGEGILTRGVDMKRSPFQKRARLERGASR